MISESFFNNGAKSVQASNGNTTQEDTDQNLQSTISIASLSARDGMTYKLPPVAFHTIPAHRQDLENPSHGG